MEYTTRELTKEEADALTKDLQEVLEKHGAEIGVRANIEILKRVESVLSPIQPLDRQTCSPSIEETPTIKPNGDSTTNEDKTDETR